MSDWSVDPYWLPGAAFFATSAFGFEHLYGVRSLRTSHRSACFRGGSGGPAFQTGLDVQPRKGVTHFEPGYLTLPEALAVSASAGARSSSLGVRHHAVPRQRPGPVLLGYRARRLDFATETPHPPMRQIAKHIGVSLQSPDEVGRDSIRTHPRHRNDKAQRFPSDT